MGMIPWGKVVDAWKETAALWGKINGSWQVLEENFGAPYNEALALVGIDKVDSLSVILTNSEYCTALAGNAEAVEIMKANYSADMTNAIDNNFSDGLNLLNYEAKAKCYLYRAGNRCENITGGYSTSIGSGASVDWETEYVNIQCKGAVECSIITKNVISFEDFGRLEAHCKPTKVYSSRRFRLAICPTSTYNADTRLDYIDAGSFGSDQTLTIHNVEEYGDHYAYFGGFSSNTMVYDICLMPYDTTVDYYNSFIPTATPSAGYGVVSKLVKLEAGDTVTFVQTVSDSTFRNELSLYTGTAAHGEYPEHYYENLTAVWSNLGFTGTATVSIEQDGMYCFNAYNAIAFESIIVTKPEHEPVVEPYNEALKLVGLSKADSLNTVLASSDICTALAGNAEAYGIMKENYSADMTAAIDSSWNEGLNLLNYKCSLKCWLFKAGNQCTGITGGWVTGNKGYVSGSALGVNSGSSSYSTVSSNNKISGSFSTIYFVVTSTNGKVRLGMSNTKSAHDTGSMSWYVNTESAGTKSGSFVNNAYACMFNGDSKSDQYAHISNIYITP